MLVELRLTAPLYPLVNLEVSGVDIGSVKGKTCFPQDFSTFVSGTPSSSLQGVRVVCVAGGTGKGHLPDHFHGPGLGLATDL